ncbi:MAG: enoyl-CoA hydratase-related protein, partial [Myxococcota bacterium]
MTDYEDVRFEVDAGIATVTLHRPEARNAYSERMVDELIDALQTVDRDPEIRCAIITGAGKAFSAGGDLKRMAADQGMFAGGDPASLRRSYVHGIQRIPEAVARIDTPLVAAVNGPAIGAGLDLACMCDIRFAAEGAKFGSTFTRVGL